MKQHSFLLGVLPDIVLLCITPDDDLLYIKNTIKYIEGATDAKVLALVIFPMMRSQSWKGIFNEKEKASFDIINQQKKDLFLNLSVPSYILGEKQEMESLADLITDYFTYEGEGDET